MTKKIKKKVNGKKVVDNITVRSMDLSLNGILEYDMQDKHEETAEVQGKEAAFVRWDGAGRLNLIVELDEPRPVSSIISTSVPHCQSETVQQSG